MFLRMHSKAFINCRQAIPSSASLVVNDENMVTETCNTLGSDDVQVEKNSTMLQLVIILNCSHLPSNGSVYTGYLLLENIGGSYVLPGIQFGRYIHI